MKTKNEIPQNTQSVHQRLQMLADITESTAKWFSLHNLEGCSLQAETQREFDVFCATPETWLFRNVLFQMSRFVAELKLIAESRDIEISDNLKQLQWAVDGTFFDKHPEDDEE